MKPIATATVQLNVADSTTMPAYTAVPAEPNGAAMLVLQEAFGVTAHIRGVADRFAAQGYLAIAPELFHRTAEAGYEGPYDNFAAVMPHYQAITDQGLTADIQAAFAWLTAQPSVVKNHIGCIGFCMGGRATFLANGILPFKAAVSAYGGGIAPDLLPLAAKQSGPLILAWGGADKHIDAAQRSAVATVLAESGKDFSEVLFASADHGFFCADRSAYNAGAAQQGWSLIDSFFGLHLLTAEAALGARKGTAISAPTSRRHGAEAST